MKQEGVLPPGIVVEDSFLPPTVFRKAFEKLKPHCSAFQQAGGKRKKDEIYVDSLDFNKKILHTAWHPSENVIAVAATNNLFLLQVINYLSISIQSVLSD